MPGVRTNQLEVIPLPILPATLSDRGNGGDMGRAIQRLEDLHHGFAMDRLGERHSALALEAVVGASHHLGGDFKGGVLYPDKSFHRLVEHCLIFGGQLVICGPSTHQHCLF